MKKVYSTRRPDFLYFIPDFIAVLLIALFLLSFKGRTVDMKLHGAAVNISDLSVINEVEITIKGTASYKLFQLTGFDGTFDVDGFDIVPKSRYHASIVLNDGFGTLFYYPEDDFQSIFAAGNIICKDGFKNIVILPNDSSVFIAAPGENIKDYDDLLTLYGRAIDHQLLSESDILR